MCVEKCDEEEGEDVKVCEHVERFIAEWDLKLLPWTDEAKGIVGKRGRMKFPSGKSRSYTQHDALPITVSPLV
jgi:hypothetical protein